MIEVMQGTLGSGKSAAAVARAILHLRKGGVVAANFSLIDGWSTEITKRFAMSYLPFGWGENYCYKKSSCMYNRFFRVDGIEAIKKISPRDLAVDVYKDKGGYSEGAGLLILDEFQLMAKRVQVTVSDHRSTSTKTGVPSNNQEHRYRSHGQAKNRNFDFLKVSKSAFIFSKWSNLFVNHLYSMSDQKDVPTKFSGLREKFNPTHVISPIPRIPLWAARLYDSLEVFACRKPEDLSAEPRLCGNPPEPPSGAGGFSPPVRRSTLCPIYSAAVESGII